MGRRGGAWFPAEDDANDGHSEDYGDDEEEQDEIKDFSNIKKRIGQGFDNDVEIEYDEEDDPNSSNYDDIIRRLKIEITHIINAIREYNTKTNDSNLNRSTNLTLNTYVQENIFIKDLLSLLSNIFTDYPNLYDDTLDIQKEQKNLMMLKEEH